MVSSQAVNVLMRMLMPMWTVGLIMFSYIHLFLKLKKIYDPYNANIVLTYAYYLQRSIKRSFKKFCEKLTYICLTLVIILTLMLILTGLNRPLFGYVFGVLDNKPGLV